MPEILTKHPDVVRQVLKSQGAQCGAGIAPKILTRCPPEKFCVLQGGELCIYGPQELGQMTQLTRGEVCGAPSPKAAITPAEPAFAASLALVAIAAIAVLGRAWRGRFA